MARPKAKAPARRYHLSGQSVVTINHRDYYLGPHDSPESIARYAVLIGIYQAGGLSLPDDFELAFLDERVSMLLGQATTAKSLEVNQPVFVRHVTACFRELIPTKYVNDPNEIDRLTRLCDELDEHDGDVQVSQYGPVLLQRQRQRWIDKGNSRKYVNRGKTKAVPLNADAMDAITDYLNRDPKSFCFSPQESVAWWQAGDKS